MVKSNYPIGSTDSILAYASNSQQRTPAPPPPPPETPIGAVTITGSATVTSGDVTTYAAANAGNAAELTYEWAIEGGTGTSTTASCEVTWGDAGEGKVTCTIRSAEANDSPSIGDLEVTIS